MSSNHTHPSQTPDYAGKPAEKKRYTIIKIILPLIIIGFGIAGATYLKNSTPKAKKRQPTTTRPLVQVRPLTMQAEQVVIKAMGTVTAARQIELKSKVAGEIIRIHDNFIEGGALKKGSEILRIDPKDYELVLAQKRRTLADAQYEYEVEQGYQAVAKREWELLGSGEKGENLNSALALRKPHIERARARLKASRADLEQAELNLSRTVVRAPFNAIVLSKNIDIGARVTTNEPLGRLVDADQFWVRVSVPLDRLKWIDLPTHANAEGAPIQIIYRNQYRRQAKVSKLLNDLGSAGQMAQLIAIVDDPLGLSTNDPDAPPLLIGEFVQVEIKGHRIDRAFRVPRTALRDQDRVWLMSSDGHLKIHPVTVAWRGKEAVLVTDGLKEGDRLVVSELAAPIDGMPIMVNTDHSPTKAPPMTNSETKTTQPKPTTSPVGQ